MNIRTLRTAALMTFTLMIATSALAQPKTSIEVNVVGYTEVPYELKMGEHYDLRPGDGDPIVIRAPKRQALPPHIVAPAPPSVAPEKIVENSWDVTSSSSIIPADTELAVGPNHLVAVTSTGVFAYTKSDGNSILSMGLGGFFASLSPSTEPTFPVAFYDDFRDRFVVMAVDVDAGAPDSDLLVAVSVAGDPSGSWHQLKVPTLLPSFDPDGPGGPDPSSPHLATRPQVGFESSQIYIAFSMVGSSGDGGTAVWNLWKDPLYAGGNTTIQAGIRPFSSGSDYANEVPLRPARIRGAVVGEPVDRGIFLVGYQGKEIGGVPSLQVLWLTTVSPSVSKFVVPLGENDDLSLGEDLPLVPQRNGAAIEVGGRFVTGAVWQNGKLWLATTIVPTLGQDAGEVTAHWAELDAPNTGSISLADWGNVSGDALVAQAHTFLPSLDVSASGIIGIGYSLSAPDLELSSVFSFVGPQCDEAQVTLAPEFLRRGLAVWAGAEWGAYSDTVIDSGLCFWHHNSHPAVGALPTWQSAVGRFCFDPGLIFGDGFESGNTGQWCSVD